VGLSKLAQNASEKVGDAFDMTKASATETYSNLASASVEKQKEFVIGKTAAHDVILPTEGLESPPEPHEQTPGTAPEHVTFLGEFLVRAGQSITEQQANLAVGAGVLHQLVSAAAGGAAGEAVAAGKEKISSAAVTGSRHAENAGATLQQKAEAAAIGKTAAREVLAEDGTTLVAAGEIVTSAILDNARLCGKEKEVLAVAGIGAASQSAQEFSDSASKAVGSLWSSARKKMDELTHSPSEKTDDSEQPAE